jgi:hypothetical protein
MAFSDYKNVSQIQQQFKIKYQEDNSAVRPVSQSN